MVVRIEYQRILSSPPGTALIQAGSIRRQCLDHVIILDEEGLAACWLRMFVTTTEVASICPWIKMRRTSARCNRSARLWRLQKSAGCIIDTNAALLIEPARSKRRTGRRHTGSRRQANIDKVGLALGRSARKVISEPKGSRRYSQQNRYRWGFQEGQLPTGSYRSVLPRCGQTL